MKTITKIVYAAFVAFALAYFALEPRAEAVMPAPDGGYPGGNTAEGQSALLSLTTGSFNTALGFFSLTSNTTGSYNTATGGGALFSNTTGNNNTANGLGALLSNTTGSANTATGNFALAGNTTADGNTANGASALVSNTIGESNTAVGVNALSNNTTGRANTAIGSDTLQENTTGVFNTAVGDSALFFNTTSGGNTAVGSGALGSNTTGFGNTALGAGAGNGVTTASGVICIGTDVHGANVSNSCYIGNIFGQTSFEGVGVFVNSDGKLGTSLSSRRFKKDIRAMDKASEAILSFKPVTFHYKIDSKGVPQFGLIAEEVAEVNPDLVVRDKEGKPYTVRYDAVNAMLLNEFLKEHREVEQQEATIAELRKQMETVVARLKEHDSKIQRVSGQIELSKAVGQTALNNP